MAPAILPANYARRVDGTQLTAHRRPVVLAFDPWAVTADMAIREQIDYFSGLNRAFEWKLHSNDQPIDLASRLIAHGFVAGEADMVMDIDALDQDIAARARDYNDAFVNSHVLSDHSAILSQASGQLHQAVSDHEGSLAELKGRAAEISSVSSGSQDSADKFKASAASPEGRELRRASSYIDWARTTINSGDLDNKTQRLGFLDIASDSVELADESLVAGNAQHYRAYIDIALELTDVALGFVPGVSWGKDIYAACLGKSLVTGHGLTTFERSMALLGAVTVGIGSKVGKITDGLQIVGKIIRKGSKTEEALAQAGKSIEAAEKIIDSAKNIRGKMSNLGEAIPGTTIPKYFRLKAEGAEFFVNPNATKHMGEYINSLPTSHGFPLRNDVILASFESSVKDAVKSGAWKTSLDSGQPIVSGSWELIFAKRATDELIVIKHALMKK